MQRCATRVLSRLCQNQTWRKKVANGTDVEWLELTNRLIKEYNAGIENVRAMLLHLGPKQPTPQPESIRTYFSPLKQGKNEELM